MWTYCMDSYLGVLNLIPDSPSHLGLFETAAAAAALPSLALR